MKRYFYFAVSVLCVAILESCSSGTTPKHQLSPAEEYIAGLTNTDSTQMLQLCDDCMELLRQRDINGALSLIGEYNDETKTVAPLSEESRARLTRLFTNFPVFTYERTEATFIEQGVNNVKYSVVFSLDDHAKTAFMFNPVKVDGVWHLTMKQQHQKLGNEVVDNPIP